MKLFVWDLHGTLECGNDRAVIDISNNVLACHGYVQRFSYEDGCRLYGLKWYEYFLWLLGEDSYYRAIELQEACFALSEENPDLQYRWIRPTVHVAEVLAAISEKHDQILISNTRPATLDVFVKLLGLEEFFSVGSLFAVDQHARDALRTKAHVLEDFLRSSRGYEDLVIIGDSPSDMKLAEVAGGTTCLFTHPGFEFRDCAADLRIRDLRRVLDLV